MIYILRFSTPIHHAKYYLGWCRDDGLSRRIAEHRAGAGARLTQVAVERGIGFDVVATLPGDRATERRLKNRKNTPKLVERLTNGKTVRL